MAESGVHADAVRTVREWPDPGVLAHQGHMPASGRALRHGHGGRLHARREGTRPHHVQRLRHPRRRRLPVPEAEHAGRALGGPAGFLARLETRVLGALGKEAGERRPKAAQGPLKRDGGDLVEAGEFPGLLPCRRHRRRGVASRPAPAAASRPACAPRETRSQTFRTHPNRRDSSAACPSVGWKRYLNTRLTSAATAHTPAHQLASDCGEFAVDGRPALAANRPSPPCSAGVRFLPTLKSSISSKEIR